jgi:phage terminase large subunit-like protein
VSGGRPAKTLAQHVREGTFRSRRHHPLLADPLLPWAGFAALQIDYQRAQSDAHRRAIGVAFEQMVAAGQREIQAASGDAGGALQEQLAEFGKRGSAAHVIEFFERYLRHPKGPMIEQPFTLEPWQKRFVREFYRRDREGRRVYRLGLLAIPRGSGKTAFAAGLALYELVTRSDAPEVYFAAGSKEQAGVAFDFARRFVENGPLADWVTARRILICPATRGVLRVISSEGALQHGLAPAAAIIDELWALETLRQTEAYTALTTALHKREDAYLLAITTAGYNRQSLLGRIYERALTWPDIERSKDGCLTIAKDDEHGNLVYWYGAPADADIDDRKIWRACNPARFVKLRDLDRHRHDPGLTDPDFRRLHLNQWTETRDVWIPAGAWEVLKTDERIPDGAEIYVGVDVGIYHDTTAVVWAHVLGDGRMLLRARVWAADETAKAHFYSGDGHVHLEDVEAFIFEQLATKFRIREVAFDPHFFARSAELLEDRGLTMVEYASSSATMKDAYQGFYQDVLESRLAHNGDPILAAHIGATAAIMTERGWRLRKLRNSERIDATIAAVLALARARHHKDRTPDIRWFEV